MEQDEDGFERIMPRRSLGEGHWDKRLKSRMVELSNADEYQDANKEWIVTDNVWYVPFGEEANLVLPDVHCNGPNTHAHECLCGHPIVWHFEILNTENDNRQIVGSEHIESYMVIRYFQSKGYDPAEVTEEMIDEWVNQKVKSLKAQWWWDLHGEQFEEWFTEVRELDLRVNVRRTTRYRWDNTHQLFGDGIILIILRDKLKLAAIQMKGFGMIYRFSMLLNNNIDNKLSVKMLQLLKELKHWLNKSV